MTSVGLAESSLFDAGHYSSFQKLVRIVAEVLRFSQRLRKKVDADPVDRLEQAERWVFKWAQQQFFAVEIDCVRRGVALPAGSKVAKYRLALDKDGLLRLETRLSQAKFLTN